MEWMDTERSDVRALDVRVLGVENIVFLRAVEPV